MTPDQLFRDPMVDYIVVSLRQVSRDVVHKINIAFPGPQIHSLTDAELGALIKLRVENAKMDLAVVVARSIP